MDTLTRVLMWGSYVCFAAAIIGAGHLARLSFEELRELLRERRERRGE